MPYSIQTDDDITVDNIPDTVAPDAPELKQRVQQVRIQRMQQSPEFKAKVDVERARGAEEYSPTKGMGPLDLASANWSAGYGNLTQGLQQLAGKAGIGSGVSDDEIREKRARDEQLAAALPYGVGKAYQIGGEALPLAAVPVGGGLAAGGLRGALQAGAGGAAASAVGAALGPVTEDESRGSNMAMAAGIGAVLPGAGNVVGQGLRKGSRVLTEAGARTRAAQQIAERVSDRGRVPERLHVLQEALGNAPETKIPMTAAQATGDAQLQGLEAASRTRPQTESMWSSFVGDQNRAKNEVLQAMTPSARRVEAAERLRRMKTAPLREGALGEAAQAGGFAEPVQMYADALLSGDTGANPAVRSIANYLKGALGESPTPGRLYEARKVLAAKLEGRPVLGDELSAAAKGAQRETRALIGAIDDALDSASSGQWKPYLAEYGARSKPIESAKVLRQAVGSLEKGLPLGATPEITATGFRRALKPEGRYGNKLTPQDMASTNEYADELRRIEAPARTRKQAGTQGGSNTAMDSQAAAELASRALEAVVPGGKVLTKAARMASGYNAAAVERHMAELLQSPTELGAALRALPPEALQEVWQQVLHGSALGGVAAMTR